MSSRERILCTLDHREPDRCATFRWMTGQAARKLLAYMGLETQEELEEALGIDRWRGVGLKISDPPDLRERLRPFRPDWFDCREDFECLEDGRLRKSNGYVVWSPLQETNDPAALDDYPFETPECIGPVTEELRTEIERLKESDAVVTAGAIQPFKKAWELRGMENLLCDFLVNPEIAEALYDHIYGFVTAYCVRLAEAGVDMVQIYGDLAMQDRLLMKRETWCRFDKPRLARLIREVKAASPSTYVFMHTDGDVTEIVPDLVEVGLDVLNPIQPECMDPFEVKERWGDRIVLHGGVSIQRTLPFGTVNDVKREVRELVVRCGRGGGYVLGPTNGITGDVPPENIVAIYEAVRETS